MDHIRSVMKKLRFSLEMNVNKTEHSTDNRKIDRSYYCIDYPVKILILITKIQCFI